MMKALNIISYMTLTITFSLMLATGYFVLYDSTHPPSTNKIIHSDKEVKRGGVLTVLSEIERLRDCRVISSREITNIKNDRLYELDPIDRILKRPKILNQL